jgi:hypothetical protein
MTAAIPLMPPPVTLLGSRKAVHPKVKMASPSVMKK